MREEWERARERHQIASRERQRASGEQVDKLANLATSKRSGGLQRLMGVRFLHSASEVGARPRLSRGARLGPSVALYEAKLKHRLTRY